jgi:hypothetical protein
VGLSTIQVSSEGIRVEPSLKSNHHCRQPNFQGSPFPGPMAQPKNFIWKRRKLGAPCCMKSVGLPTHLSKKPFFRLSKTRFFQIICERSARFCPLGVFSAFLPVRDRDESPGFFFISPRCHDDSGSHKELGYCVIYMEDSTKTRASIQVSR